MAKKKTKKKEEKSDLDLLLDGTGVGLLVEQPEVRVIPTDFVGFNRATRVGGLPLSCVSLVYGPSQGGKTAFVLGLIRSFQRQGHFAFFVDAEHTLDRDWATACGVDPELPYERPGTYETARDKIHKIFANFIKGRDKGKIHPQKALIVVVDSLNKLVPEAEATKKKIDKAFPLRALFNTIWLDQIAPIVHKYPIHLVLIAHEKKKIDSGKWEDDKRVKGGSGIYYDSSLVVRIYTRKVIRVKDSKSEMKVEVGILHEGFVEKNKVGVCHESFPFIMSTGRGSVPIGFDLVREIMEEAKIRDQRSPLVRKPGGEWRCEGLPEGKIKGDPNMRSFLRQNPDFADKVVEEMNKSALESLDTGEREENE